MKIATFNVNGISSRLPHLLQWLEREAPDIVCLQELKAADARFPAAQIRDAGYGAIWQGQKPLWNGVAILARGTDPIEMRRGLPGDPADTQSRYLEAAVAGHPGRLPLPAQRQSAARPEVRLQARLVRAPHRARRGARRQPASGGAGRRLQRGADRRRHLQPALLAQGRAAAAADPRALPAPARPGLDSMRIRSSIRRSASTPSGTTSGSTGSATPACASITCCSIRHWRRGSRRWAWTAGCAAWNVRATTRPRG